ncbi:substrate-binding domain-containing protein [Herbivorax sp. ANBcel31]|uniref:substrate-binding domain-containing protein n=1 Tax=Herbivorax sp. ANBcel31 TaxID=3069754 RepID=UPI0027AEB9B3|nr:substrate-binding domain-containing protein [Herbivorax sp. ANBcel31]MDQ2086599.1 substrate-binding domain-containing protein [Herbivorax sp. ANBcel31]
MSLKAKSDKSKIISRTRTIINLLTGCIIVILLMVLSINYFTESLEKYATVQTVLYVLALFISGFLLFFIKRFFKGIDLINYNAYLLSKGKLNISDILLSKVKGLETLCIAFNDMKTNLLTFTELTKTNIVVISDAIDEVTENIDKSLKGNEQIAANMGDLTEKSQEQLKNAKDTLDSIYNVDERVSSIENSLSNVEKIVKSVVGSTTEGNENLDEYYNQMDVITNNLSSTSEFVERLNNELEEINNLGELITEIAEQLKMLALNASIESARAGESGVGFSVVASEMNKLSDETSKSIKKINMLLKNVSDSSLDVKGSIANCIENYNMSKDIFSQIKESFHTIKSSTDILSEDINKVYSEAGVISNSTHEVKEKGQYFLNASDKISSASEEVAAVTQEEVAGSETVNNNILSLKDMLYEIEKLVRRFKTSVTPVEKASTKKLKIAFLSPLDHEFWFGVRQGAMYAKKELSTKNADIEYFGFSENTWENIVDVFKESLEKGVDGVVVPGLGEEIVPLIEEASQKNIPVMTYNCDLAVHSKRTAYFGPDIGEAGTLAADFMLKALNGRGNVAILRGADIFVYSTRRQKIKERLKSKRRIKIVADIEGGHDDVKVCNLVKDLLSQNSNIHGIFVAGLGVKGAAKAIKELNMVGKVKIVCFDFDKEIFELIKEGIIYAAIGQDPFGQGHDPIVYLYNYLVTNEKPESEVIWTRTDVVDKNNVDDLI